MADLQHYWQGDWIDDLELERRLADPVRSLGLDRARTFSIEALLHAAEILSGDLREDPKLRGILMTSLAGELPDTDTGAAGAAIEELAAFLTRASLQEKVKRELGTGNPRVFPFRLERVDPRTEIFEAWAPLGFLVHITPSNAVNVPFLAMFEGLLCGNVNFVKTAENPGVGGAYPQLCAEALVERDPSGHLRDFIAIAAFSSRRRSLLVQLLRHADGVSAWGSEEAIESVRAMVPAHARFVPWGHKISFAYFTASRLADPVAIEALAKDVCLYDQQACSSPQVVYVEAESREAQQDFADSLAESLARVSSSIPGELPDSAAQAELSQAVLMSRMERALHGLPDPVRSGVDACGRRWSVLIDETPGLEASPLYRTIRVKRLPRSAILRTLRPLRQYLQTVGLVCPPADLPVLTDLFFRAGALRITRAGRMTEGYVGEPHDGVFALQRFARRVSVAFPELPPGISALNETPLTAPEKNWERDLLKGKPLLGKRDLQRKSAALSPEHAQVYFKSGGSTGEPVLSAFTYEDYETQMKLSSQGLLAAGLQPGTDRCANLFFAGGLYGGFLSFFTILEEMRAVQLPIAALPDFKAVGKLIVDCEVNTLLGMPSYLWNLLVENEELFRAARAKGKGIDKIFFGGEHFTRSQREALVTRFGIRVIRSAAYGSNDTGPIGFQCPECAGSVHHLHERMQLMEILKLDADEPVEEGEIGRIVLSSRIRSGQSLLRYEIGDLGRWVPGPCPCGRSVARFELLGRYGDVFKVGSAFLNYKVFAALPQLRGEFQLVVTNTEGNDHLLLRIAAANGDSIRLREECLRAYPDLAEIVERDRTLSFDVQVVEAGALVRSSGSGKLRSVIDERRIR